jgi:glycosyltransferase involved in cell wall biosynthesis
MLNSPKVSVILTSYNHAKYLHEAIESILTQTFIDFELIIWDDASTDMSWEIIQSYDDSRIKASMA